MAQAIEEELKKLSKLPENRRCANCEAENRFGWSNICIKFRVFVCGKCKSSFQAYSFRVKELGQSNFTDEEVASLRSRNGGGNDVARATFLARLPLDSPQRLREGDPDAKYKAFVIAVYEERRYWAPAASGSSSSGGAVPPPRPLASAGSGASPSPRVDLASVKGRWGPANGGSGAASPSMGSGSSPAASSVGGLRRQDSGFSAQSSVGGGGSAASARAAAAAPVPASTTPGRGGAGGGEAWMRDGADGITVRTEPPPAPPGAAAEEVDLLGVGFGVAAAPPAAATAAASVASSLDGYYAAAPAAPSAAAAAILGAYGGGGGSPFGAAPAPPHAAPSSGFGFNFGAVPVPGEAMSGGGGANAISGLLAAVHGGGVQQQQQQQNYGFGMPIAQPATMQPAASFTMPTSPLANVPSYGSPHMQQQHVLGSGSGGLDAVMRGLADAEQQARAGGARSAPPSGASPAASAVPLLHPAPGAAGLESLMAGFAIGGVGLRAGTAGAAPPPAPAPRLAAMMSASPAAAPHPALAHQPLAHTASGGVMLPAAPMVAPSAAAMGISALLALSVGPALPVAAHGVHAAGGHFGHAVMQQQPHSAGAGAHHHSHHHHHHHGHGHSAPPVGHGPHGAMPPHVMPAPQQPWAPPQGTMGAPQRAFDPFFGI